MTIKPEEFIQKAISVHGTTYDYSKTHYVNARTAITIICHEHGEFTQMPPIHLRGSGCPKCGCKTEKFKNRTPKSKMTTEEFIEKAKSVHGNKFDYSKTVYTGAHNKIIIICPTHGEFEQKASSHLLYDCKKCADEQNGKRSRKTLTEFIKEAGEIHNHKYDYRNVVMEGMHKKIKIICPVHGEFEQYANDHLKGNGCFKCGVDKRSHETGPKYNTDTFIKKAMNIHGNKYDYSKTIFNGTKNKVIITCPIHGDFEQLPNNHLCGNGCPSCIINYRVSKLERDWLDYLQIPNCNRQKTLYLDNRRFHVDGYDPDNKIIYEFLGDYWHGNPAVYNSAEYNSIAKLTMGELYQRTIARNKVLSDNGWSVITMWENEWNRINKKSTNT